MKTRSKRKATSRTSISARLPKEIVERVQRAMQKSGSSFSEVIVAALERYCRELDSAAHESPAEYWLASGLIGSIKDPSLSSVNYKQLLGESLERKHGHR